MPIQKRKEKLKNSTKQVIVSTGLFLVTLLMWLLWGSNTLTVLLTGTVAILAIIDNNRIKEGKKPLKEFRFRRN